MYVGNDRINDRYVINQFATSLLFSAINDRGGMFRRIVILVQSVVTVRIIFYNYKDNG